MRKEPLAIAAICFALAALIFVFAKEARRIYAAIFFAMLGVVTVVSAKRGTQRQQ